MKISDILNYASLGGDFLQKKIEKELKKVTGNEVSNSISDEFISLHKHEIESIRIAVSPMLSFKKGVDFSDLELMLGFFAHIVWASGGSKITLVPDDHLYEYVTWYYGDGNNVSARASAIFLMEKIQRYPEIITKIKNKKKSFESQKELNWAKQAVDPPGWDTTLTRSVILVSRGLAYQSSGRIDSTSPKILGNQDEFCKQWASSFLGGMVASSLYNDAIKFDLNNISWKLT